MKSCTCAACVSCCENVPGWMTPDEARAALDAGLHDRLMADWWVGSDENIYALIPATLGCEGKYAPQWPGGTCTFLKAGLCEIHNSGFKPSECKAAMACAGGPVKEPNKSTIWKLWDSPEGRALVERWESLAPGAINRE